MNNQLREILGMRNSHYLFMGVFGAVLLAGCSNDSSNAVVPMVDDGYVQPNGSVTRLQADVSRASSYTQILNNYRRQAFGTDVPVEHRNELYTAAYRHAVNLNTVNSRNYDPAARYQGPDAAVLTVDSNNADMMADYTGLLAKGTGGAGGKGGSGSGSSNGENHTVLSAPFPAFGTGNTPVQRLTSVVGGSELLGFSGEVFEGYAFRGTLTTTKGAVNPDLRGFTSFDPVTSLWYSRRGRTIAMRAGVTAYGFAGPNDDPLPTGAVVPPYPLFENRFLGVFDFLMDNGVAASSSLSSCWPNDDNRSVIPYGLDVADSATPNSGPPIHVTLPSNEPILSGTAGTLFIEFSKMPYRADAPTVAQAPLSDPASALFSVYTASSVPSFSVCPQYRDTAINPSFSASYAFTGGGPRLKVVSGAAVTQVQPNSTTGNAFWYDGDWISFAPGTSLSLANPGDSFTITLASASLAARPGNNSGMLGSYSGTIQEVRGNRIRISPAIMVVMTRDTGNGVQWGWFDFLSFDDPSVIAADATAIGSITSNTVVGTIVESDPRYALRGAEMIILPNRQLEADTWYEIGVYAKAGSYEFKRDGNPGNMRIWRFKTQ